MDSNALKFAKFAMSRVHLNFEEEWCTFNDFRVKEIHIWLKGPDLTLEEIYEKKDKIVNTKINIDMNRRVTEIKLTENNDFICFDYYGISLITHQLVWVGYLVITKEEVETFVIEMEKELV